MKNLTIIQSEPALQEGLSTGNQVVVGQRTQMIGEFVTTVVQRAKRLLAREDADVADEVAKVLRG